eukprot:CAMPEP_0196570396 /NCGR_PEP_ID=MMETSP1081-20130531/452_1 /TAXON_ID=36882 /ORGANISM="Pyramimonas amylifera, Strain CCMP720" /LENGTH=178 /DNA_ID=CAMNT_0041886813 /DNA_START=193 /DNA_END=729 /DNA_ORIENTATION=+
MASMDRREMLSLVGVAAASLIASKAQATQDILLIDDLDKRSKGFELIYEARDLEITERTRPGEATRTALQRLPPKETADRIAESAKRIKSVVPPLVAKEYFPAAREELRRQVGYLRMDINTLADGKSGAEKKAQKVLNKNCIDKLEALDFELRSKKQDASNAAFAALIPALDAVVGSV